MSAEPERQATIGRVGGSSGIPRILREGDARWSRPVHRPGLDERWIGQGKVVKERSVGPLAGLLSGRGIGGIGRRAELG